MLPAELPLDAYRPFRRDVEAQRPAMEAIAARHGLPPSELAPFSQGTQIVWGTQRSVIKLFVPTWPEDTRIEMLMLERLVGAGLPVPQLEARGEVAGWPYVVMSRLPGQRVPEAWPELDADARERLAHDIGAAMAHLAALPVTGLDALLAPQESLLAERRPRLLQDQRERGGDDALDGAAAGVPRRTAAAAAGRERPGPRRPDGGQHPRARRPARRIHRLRGCLRGPVDLRAGGDVLLRDAGRSTLAACAPCGPRCRGDARAPRHAALLGGAPPLQPRRDHDAARRPRKPVELARHAVVALRTRRGPLGDRLTPGTEPTSRQLVGNVARAS